MIIEDVHFYRPACSSMLWMRVLFTFMEIAKLKIISCFETVKFISVKNTLFLFLS